MHRWRLFKAFDLSRQRQPEAQLQRGARLFLACQFQDYDNRRDLALHGMLRAANSGLPFVRAELYLDDYLRQVRFGFGDVQEISLRLDLDGTISEPGRSAGLRLPIRLEPN